MEISIVIPALDEERTIAFCVDEAKAAIAALSVEGEVVVADNGSRDKTREIAQARGARVVEIARKGYGSALMGGFAAAKGRYLLMGDADGSYDFRAAGRYLEKLRAGADLVVGNRFKGRIEPGAMPFKNRRLGTPVLTFIMNTLFRSDFGDVNCGMRGLTKEAFERLGLKAPGMEFATEMLVKASLLKLEVAEVPCDLRRDRRDRPPHLRPWRDGWRHLRFMLLFSPTGTFMVPGGALCIVGFAGLAGVTLRDALAPEAAAAWLGSRHVLTALLAWLLGTSVISLGLVAQEAGYSERFDKGGRVIEFLHRTFSIERGLAFGVLLALAGLAGLAYFPISFATDWLPQVTEPLRLDLAVLAIAAALTGAQCAFTSLALGMFYLRVK